MTKEDIQDFYTAIDRFDTRTFADYLDDNARFKFANIPVITGKNNIFEFVAAFFQSIRAIRHRNLEIHELEGIRFVMGNVTYTRLDGSALSVDFSHTLKLYGDKIKEFLIFIDNSALFK